MNPEQAFKRYGVEKLRRVQFYSQGWEREGLIYIPEHPRLLAGGDNLYLHVFDSASFIDFKPRLGMLYPNNLPTVAEAVGAYCVSLLPLGWGPRGLVKAFHARGTPLEHRRLPDDVQAIAGLMNRMEQYIGKAQHGLAGFANAGAFVQVASCATSMRQRVQFVIGVNSTIWANCPEFQLALPPAGQSALFINGGSNKRICWDGQRAPGFLGWLGETLVAKMPLVTGPQLQLPRYVESNSGLASQSWLTSQSYTGAGDVVTTTYKGHRPDGRPAILRQIFDPNLPHMWPGRVINTPDSESAFSPGNRFDEHGKKQTPNVDANEEIVRFLNELYPA